MDKGTQVLWECKLWFGVVHTNRLCWSGTPVVVPDTDVGFDEAIFRKADLVGGWGVRVK